MGKNIVVCCDGTSNKFNARRTNAAKLCFVMEQKAGSQEVYYHPGLGTMEPPGALTNWAIRLTRFAGLVFGYGLEADIRDAYVFLMNHFQKDDQVYVFGFSRGAYTARALTSLLHMYGLLRPGNEPLVPYAIRMMLGVNDIKENTPGRGISAADKSAIDEIHQLAGEFKRTFSTQCKPHFVGLWDTVNSVGFLSEGFHCPYTSNNPDIAVARHALSIDERRGFFRPSGWFPKEPRGAWDSGPKDLLEVWFPGDHSDIGGGYPEKEAGLSKGALKWMVCEAIAHGLSCDKRRLKEMFGEIKSDYIKPDANGMLHNSMTFGWNFAEILRKRTYDPKTKTWPYRRNWWRRREIPEGANLHQSTVDRTGYLAKCRNLPKTYTVVGDLCDPAQDIEGWGKRATKT